MCLSKEAFITFNWSSELAHAVASSTIEADKAGIKILGSSGMKETAPRMAGCTWLKCTGNVQKPLESVVKEEVRACRTERMIVKEDGVKADRLLLVVAAMKPVRMAMEGLRVNEWYSVTKDYRVSVVLA